MAKKKINPDSLIAVELEKLQKKVNEFQTYLELNSINYVISKDREFDITVDTQDKLHKEIIVQIKMQDALFNWLPVLEQLKAGKTEDSNAVIETRGDIPVNGLFNKKTRGLPE